MPEPQRPEDLEDLGEPPPERVSRFLDDDESVQAQVVYPGAGLTEPEDDDAAVRERVRGELGVLAEDMTDEDVDRIIAAVRG